VQLEFYTFGHLENEGRSIEGDWFTMARGRKPRATGTSASSTAQSRLSFNNNSAKVIKPSTRADDASKRAEALKLSEPAQLRLEDEVSAVDSPQTETKSADVEITPEPETNEVDVVIRQSPRKAKTFKKTTIPVKDEREGAAEKVTDAQIKKYWKAEEDSRLAPRGNYPYHLKPFTPNFYLSPGKYLTD
jgi:DNA polymerase delta subunit 4